MPKQALWLRTCCVCAIFFTALYTAAKDGPVATNPFVTGTVHSLRVWGEYQSGGEVTPESTDSRGKEKRVCGTPVLSTRRSLLISQYSFVSRGQSRCEEHLMCVHVL